jgi:hypothetical protein
MDMSPGFDTKRIPDAPDAIAPDGSEVHLLGSLPRGSMAVLPPGAGGGVESRLSSHSRGDLVLYRGTRLDVAQARRPGRDHRGAPGVSITLPIGTQFQFRCDGGARLEAVAVTMPPWPGADEAHPGSGIWESTF